MQKGCISGFVLARSPAPSSLAAKMPPPSFTISEFSALVSAALDGRGANSEPTIGNGFLSPNGTDVGKLESKARSRFYSFNETNMREY